jgi:hypothetical protein
MPPLAYRDRHNWTVGGEVAVFAAPIAAVMRGFAIKLSGCRDRRR